MEEKQIQWSKIYLALMGSLVVMIALMYWLTRAYS
jgi:hypothetical protein